VLLPVLWSDLATRPIPSPWAKRRYVLLASLHLQRPRACHGRTPPSAPLPPVLAKARGQADTSPRPAVHSLPPDEQLRWSHSSHSSHLHHPPCASAAEGRSPESRRATHQYSRWWKRCTWKRSEKGLTRLKFLCPTSFIVSSSDSVAADTYLIDDPAGCPIGSHLIHTA